MDVLLFIFILLVILLLLVVMILMAASRRRRCRLLILLIIQAIMLAKISFNVSLFERLDRIWLVVVRLDSLHGELFRQRPSVVVKIILLSWLILI